MPDLLAQQAADRQRVEELFRAAIPPENEAPELSDDLVLRELGMESLTILLVVTRFCEEYQIELEALPGELGRLDTVGEVLRLGARIADRSRELGIGNSSEQGRVDASAV